MAMDDPVGIWCGPEPPPPELRRAMKFILNTTPRIGNVNLKYLSISRKLLKNLPPILLDLIEIASYVYAGDQSVTRGGAALRGDGSLWRRDFHYYIPVRNLDLWEAPGTKEALIDLLTFMSDDYYDFTFRPLIRSIPISDYFVFDEGKPWFPADEVLLYSGGLDSLAGVCESALGGKRNVVLVSHRPAHQTFSVQRDLLTDFRAKAGSNGQLLHVPVLVNKSERLTKDTHQRTRSFLYASLAASLARMHNLNRIAFNENGITSCNLVATESVKGSRASRTTHPQSLRGIERFLSLVFDRPFKVDNPLFWKTKADIVKVIKDYGMQGLVRFTISCSHVRTGDKINNHCGVCSQCVGRRLAAIYNDLGEDDPEEMYRIKLPVESIEKDMDRSMVELLIKTAREFEQMDSFEFFRTHPIATSILMSLDGSSDENAARLFELHRRHGQQVCTVLEKFVEANKGLIARTGAPRKSLLGMIAGTFPVPESHHAAKRAWKLPPGTQWSDITVEIVGVDAAKIIVGDDVHAASAAEMGFEDRKKKIPNQLWDLLVDFAEGGGTLRQRSPERTKDWTPKDFQRLRSALKAYFQLEDNPIQYLRKDGYHTAFQILYDRSATH